MSKDELLSRIDEQKKIMACDMQNSCSTLDSLNNIKSYVIVIIIFSTTLVGRLHWNMIMEAGGYESEWSNWKIYKNPVCA